MLHIILDLANKSDSLKKKLNLKKCAKIYFVSKLTVSLLIVLLQVQIGSILHFSDTNKFWFMQIEAENLLLECLITTV